MPSNFGTVVLLGAGASADAGYPMAGGLLECFADEINSEEFAQIRSTLRELWSLCEGAVNRVQPVSDIYQSFPPPRPHLETFLSFIDDILRPDVQIVATRAYQLSTGERHQLRHVDEAALRSAYAALLPTNPCSYLTPLLNLSGPGGGPVVIGTLNFDLGLELAAHQANKPVYDGFAFGEGEQGKPPPGWDRSNLAEFWQLAHTGTFRFVGFDEETETVPRLLKLHGSLGWYVLEEGRGTLGTRSEMRFNVATDHFRVPYQWLWELTSVNEPSEFVSGRWLAHRLGMEGVTGKAGVVWIRPYMIFGRAIKTHPDFISVELLSQFSQSVRTADNILTVGYSWSDAHINDLLLSAVARGAVLVDVRQSPGPEDLVRFWRQRFPTTYEERGRQLFSLGGGARAVIQEDAATLPSGKQLGGNFVRMLEKQELPEGASVKEQCKQTWSAEK